MKISKGEFFSYFLGVFGILLSVYFYLISVKERQPIFQTESVRTKILSSKDINKSPIKVFKSNGEEVKRDLTSIRYYFWNQGKESIRKNNVIKNLFIS